MSPAEIAETLTTLQQAMTAAKNPPARPTVNTCGCTDPRCGACRKAVTR